MFNDTYDVIDFNSAWLNNYRNHKISMIRLWTLQYSLEGCVVALLAVFVFFLFCKCSNNQDCKFWYMIPVIRIIYKYCKYFSKFINLNE